MSTSFELDDYVAKKDRDAPATDINVLTASNSADTLQHHIHRRLTPRHLQLITIAGGIGSALFVLIGTALVSGGPIPLILGMLLWCSVIWATSNFPHHAKMEMTTLLPIDGGFMSLASQFVDPAFGCAVGWDYFIISAATLNYEITITNVVLGYWIDDLNPAIVISALLAFFFLLNAWNVKWFREVEFWVAGGKVLLVFGLAFFTFITMCGGNPIHDKYGFRYWHDPAPWNGDGALGHVEALWSVVVYAAFCIVGPDLLSLMAGEVKHPRRVLPGAFRSTIFRLLTFYGLGAVCVATVCASNDPDLIGAIRAGSAGAAKSPYVIAMKRMEIPYLGSIVNAAVLVSLLSTANTFVFTTSRSLHGLALFGQAPKIFKRQNRNGVPYVAVIVTMLIGCLSYLQLSAGTYKVLGWWVDIMTASQLITWIAMGVTYVFFDRALKAKGLKNTDFLPVKARYALSCAWYAIGAVSFTTLFQAYGIMSPSTFDVLDFFFDYAAVFIFAIIFGVWKIVKKTKTVKPLEADLTSDLTSLQAYTEECEEQRRNTILSRKDQLLDKLF